MFHPLIPYKHIKCIDVAYVPHIVDEDLDVVHLFGIWYNIPHDYIIGNDNIVVNKSDVHNWKEWKKEDAT
jgi:hypothetical protein